MSTNVTGVAPGSKVLQSQDRDLDPTATSKTDAVDGEESETERDVKAVEQPSTVEVQSDSAQRDNEALGRYVDTFCLNRQAPELSGA